jgi:hypothetical protein
MHARAECLGDQKRCTTKTTADIKDIDIRRECDQAEDISCGSFTTGADEIAPIDRFVLANFVKRILALIERIRGSVVHDAIPLNPGFGLLL